ncbi:MULTISPECIES: TetR/AcrR family transcriptional regulator [Curtobacterium]|jgi:AcrR family transcriptional regulator|uniref:TetR/AcrR family transcriptional regulator n=1 Tax=Curtobacterium TaxID=2034 RepID=UPI000689D7D9|nr:MULTISPECIES: TetR/AcrR family transcriptional regulator [Curtobacterium]MBT1606798.1 TetR/AcrR family transcriptional regulator [Curtobacterium flaccumfaciens pv. betae]MBT1657878.1 TetR/AcrR family transcriptional regulator [Curtobacterium flaccumfaciens pv. betae]MCE0459162.1 TetR/AcrR family transcriptional regulator [Curtobacterium allii]MCS0471837.1 TetR/AcrR family transcriptional regulator [Curtobacterium flaccumfaciens pv. betae]MCS0475203.1 TetR/AcrR family transcriptional regulat
MNQRQLAMEASRRAIIDAAGQQFAAFGYEATTFSRVAEAMGKPKSAIGYHLFPSKKDLATAVIELQQQRWRELFDALPAQPGIERLTVFLLTTGMDVRRGSVAGGAVRLLHELGKAGVPVPRGFDWFEMTRGELVSAGVAAADVDAAAVQPSVLLLLNTTLGMVDGSTQLTDDELVAQLKALWAPLFTSFGIAGASEVIAAAQPYSPATS